MTSDLIGKRFERLEVIERLDKTKHGVYWKCKCDCGNTKKVRGDHLLNGTTKSCGCLLYKKKEYPLHRMRLYYIWGSMKQRCNNPNDNNYIRYGGRGIKVCDEWLGGFEVFREWALTNGYDDSLSIDRIDNNGNYSPNNCKWSTRKEQCSNTRRNNYIEVNGESRILSDWARLLDVKPSAILNARAKFGSESEYIKAKLKHPDKRTNAVEYRNLG